MKKIDGKYTIKSCEDGHRYSNIMQTFEAIVLPMQSSVNEMIDIIIELKECVKKLELDNAGLNGFIKGIESPLKDKLKIKRSYQMNSNIWKDNKTLPEFGQDVLIMLNSGNYIVSDAGNFEIFHPKKWCYLEDLLSQSTRVEKLERALICAKSYLEAYSDRPGLSTALLEVNKIMGE